MLEKLNVYKFIAYFWYTCQQLTPYQECDDPHSRVILELERALFKVLEKQIEPFLPRHPGGRTHEKQKSGLVLMIFLFSTSSLRVESVM